MKAGKLKEGGCLWLILVIAVASCAVNSVRHEYAEKEVENLKSQLQRCQEQPKAITDEELETLRLMRDKINNGDY